MTKLLDLTIKINKDKYKNSTGINPHKNREIETNVKIKNQYGGNVTELKREASFSFHIQQASEFNNVANNVKEIFDDFHNLIWQIQKAIGDEQITNFIPKLEKYQNATTSSLEGKFYRLKNINDGEEKVKKICQDFL